MYVRLTIPLLVVKIAFSTLVVLFAALLAYGVFIEPRFLLDKTSFEAEVPYLSDGWEGQKVALIADFQIGMWLDNVGMIENAVEEALQENASLILVAGDFMYKPDSARAERAVTVLQPLLDAEVPVVAVLGNHDYSLMKKDSNERPPIAEYLEQLLEDRGVTVLENDAAEIPAPNGDGTLYVAGIGSVWAESSDPAAALSAVPSGAPRIVLMHNAESYRQIGPREAPLALAAHTHGGQVRLPLFPTESWLDVVRMGEVVADGWAADSIGAAENRLYVNRGIGMSTVPVRIGSRPELTLITLRRAAGTTPQRAPENTSLPAGTG